MKTAGGDPDVLDRHDLLRREWNAASCAVDRTDGLRQWEAYDQSGFDGDRSQYRFASIPGRRGPSHPSGW
jgi:hypothetical protein